MLCVHELSLARRALARGGLGSLCLAWLAGAAGAELWAGARRTAPTVPPSWADSHCALGPISPPCPALTALPRFPWLPCPGTSEYCSGRTQRRNCGKSAKACCTVVAAGCVPALHAACCCRSAALGVLALPRCSARRSAGIARHGQTWPDMADAGSPSAHGSCRWLASPEPCACEHACNPSLSLPQSQSPAIPRPLAWPLWATTHQGSPRRAFTIARSRSL